MFLHWTDKCLWLLLENFETKPLYSLEYTFTGVFTATALFGMVQPMAVAVVNPNITDSIESAC